MADGTTFTIKRQITVRAVVTPRWKEDAERELSNAISSFDQQLAQLEQEGQRLVDEIRRQSINPLDPRVQEQVGSLQQQVAAKRAELEEQKCVSWRWKRSWTRASWRAFARSGWATTWSRNSRRLLSFAMA